jgi:hypothetical protein
MIIPKFLLQGVNVIYVLHQMEVLQMKIVVYQQRLLIYKLISSRSEGCKTQCQNRSKLDKKAWPS